MTAANDTDGWARQALCKEMDPEIFFPHAGDQATCIIAKRICHQCPVKQPCRDYALADPKLNGIWGGTTYRDRLKIRNQERTRT